MSQRERGRGQSRGGFDGRDGRGGFNSRSTWPHDPYFSENKAYPESSYSPPQYSSSGIHSVHPYQSTVSPPSVHYQPTVNPLPPQYQAQSVISVNVIHSPAPVAAASQFYGESHPVQPTASYGERHPVQPTALYGERHPVQPTASSGERHPVQPTASYGGPLPPKYEHVGPASYPRDVRYASDESNQKYCYGRGNLPPGCDHFSDTSRSQLYSTNSGIRRECDYHTSQQPQRPYDHHTHQPYDHHTHQQPYDHHTHQQSYGHHINQKPQRTYGHQTNQQKYFRPQQGHAAQIKQNKQDSQDLPKGQKYGLQQKQDLSKSQKYQQKRGPSMRQTAASRSPSAAPQEPPPPYESLSFKPETVHQVNQTSAPHPSAEDKMGKKFRESKPQSRSRDNHGQSLKQRVVSPGSSTSGVSASSQYVHRDRNDLKGSHNKNVTQGQRSQDCRGMPNSRLRNRQYHNKKSGSSQGNSGEGMISDSKSLKENEGFGDNSNLERPVSTSTIGPGKRKGRGNSQGKQSERINPECDLNLHLQAEDSHVQTGVSAEASKQERELAKKKKKKSRPRRTKMMPAYQVPHVQEQVVKPLVHITRASLQILTSFKDAASLKETVELFSDKSETHHLKFVDDSIICSEKRGVCTVMISANNSQVAKDAISDLCERLRKNLNTKVMYDISSINQEQSGENDSAQSKASLTRENRKTPEHINSAQIQVLSKAAAESKQSGLSSSVLTVGENIAGINTEFSNSENSEGLPVENSGNSQVENSDGSDVENSDGSDEENSDDSDVENNDGSDVENNDGSDVENNDGSDVENNDSSDVENSDGSDVENGDGSDVENSDGSDVQCSDSSYADDNGPRESNNKGADEDNEESDKTDIDKPNDGDNEGSFEDINLTVDTKRSGQLEEVVTEILDEKDDACLGKDVDEEKMPTKLSVVVDKVFSLKADFLNLLSSICGDNISAFELVPDTFLTATSSTLCELTVPSHLDAKKIVQQINSSRQKDIHVRCFIVSDGSGSM